MPNILDLANSLIPAYTHKDVVEFEEGNTQDIISVISKNHAFAVKELKAFAKAIPGETDFIKCRNLWYFLFTNVRYQLDPLGVQLIKKPNALWGTRFGDCKSFALFICGCLENMGINYNYKYVTFSPANKDVTHVYVEAFPNGVKTIMDVPYRHFNLEKTPYYHAIIKSKKDMTQIRSIGSMDQQPQYTKIIDLGPKEIGDISEGEFDLWLAKDRLQTEKSIVAGIGRVGKAEKYQDAIDVINDAIASIGKVNDLEKEYEYIAYQAHLGRYKNADAVAGIGAADAYDFRLGAMQQRADERKAWREAGLVVPQEVVIGKLGKWLKKTAKKAVKKGVKIAKKGIKTGLKVAKVVAKIVTFPMRLAIKGILEVTLPKASPFFLYLFLTDAQSAAAPAKIKAKRRKSKDIANFIVDFVGMKRSHFMEICRNGIMKHYKMSPEKVLAKQMGSKVSGVGDIGIAPIIIQAVITIISLISKLTKKKPASSVTADDTPAAEDWGGITQTAQQLINTQLSSGKEVVNYTDSGANSTTNYTAENDTTKLIDTDSNDTFTSNTKNATTGFCK